MLFDNIYFAALISLVVADGARLKAVNDDQKDLGYLRLASGNRERDYIAVGNFGKSFSHKADEFTSMDPLESGRLTLDGNYLVFDSYSTATKFPLDENGFWKLDKTFWACSNLDGHRGAAANRLLVVVGEDKPKETCQKVRIRVETFFEAVQLYVETETKDFSMGVGIVEDGKNCFALVALDHKQTFRYEDVYMSIVDYSEEDGLSTFFVGLMNDNLALAVGMWPAQFEFDENGYWKERRHLWACWDGPTENEQNGIIRYGMKPKGGNCKKVRVTYKNVSNNTKKT